MAWLTSRDEEEVRDWGRGDRRTQGHSLRGGGAGFGACTRVVCVQMCSEVAGRLKEGLREAWKQTWAGVNELCQPQPQLHSLYDSFQFEDSRGGMGGNGGKGRTVSGGTGQVLGRRHGVGRSQGHCLACPWRWVLSATERRADGEAVDGEARRKPASEHADLHTLECGQISDLVRATGGAGAGAPVFPEACTGQRRAAAARDVQPTESESSFGWLVRRGGGKVRKGSSGTRAAGGLTGLGALTGVSTAQR